ncbi:hypothetical protein EXIGLDRAFT_834650 [Exidia glandulosa HHB12029]|uniref:MYND-type domain-containing protein n=1 Tax=Exidia glandulosa HHB12029 TaxID=1314781 RepID=A0A166ATA1_EXIGL|nr:hypothetical protein EXIGLDRAFT_834650 [Exidia glandulosa HHB12029]
MIFITTPRSEPDLDVVRESLREVSASCSRRASHVTSPAPVLDIMDDALRALAYPIWTSLESASKLCSTQLFSRKGIWPRSAADVLPLSRKDSLVTLLGWVDKAERSKRWAYICPSFYTFYLVLMVCRPELMPELFMDYGRHLCIDIMARQLDATAADMRNGIMSVSPPERIRLVINIFRVIGLGVGAQTEDWMTFARGSELKLIRALDAAWNCLDAMHHDLKQLVMVMLCGLTLATGGDGLSQRVLDEYLAVEARRTVFTGLYQNLKEISNSVECSDPECKRHAREVEGGRLQKCGSCRLVRYCSRECQKRHWSTRPRSHMYKLVCQDMKNLLAFAPLTLEEEAFESACRGSSFSPSFFESLDAILTSEQAHKIMTTRQERLVGSTNA